MQGKLLKGSIVVISAVVISTLGIFASDGLEGIDRNLVGLSGMSDGVCKAGTVEARISGAHLCVDMYEASTGSDCPHAVPRNTIESEENANSANCYAASVKGEEPWRFITLPQAQRMCAEAGKRLPTSDEWYRLALGTDVERCILTSGGPGKTGSGECISGTGVYDMIGNMWEWVDETVEGRTLRGRELPVEGYVSSVDASGVAIVTTDERGVDLYGEDYFWSKDEGVFGMIRGGFYGSGSDGGIYTINASVPTDFATQGVGFRCVEDVL